MDDSLSFESLLKGAGQAAFKAMDDHGRGEYDEFALHGGVAIERLAKAVLVKKNPTYLVEMRGNSELLLYFGGHLELSTDRVRTVGALEALNRLRLMNVLPRDHRLDLLIALRNGTAHTTVGSQARVLLPVLAETVAFLLKEVDIPAEKFWGRWTSAVNVAVDKQRNQIQKDVHLRIRQTRHLFEDRFEGLPDGVKERALQEPKPVVRAITISNQHGTLGLVSTTRCPACGTDAQVTLRPQSEGPDSEVSTLLPITLSCHLCGLALEGREEIEAAALDEDTFVLPPTVALHWAEEESADEDLGSTAAN